jgi:ABC-2 type transport system permease protein
VSGFASLGREARFMLRDRVVLVWLGVVLGLSVLAVSAGSWEVRQQRATIAHLIEADRSDRTEVLRQQRDWGAAAYNSFHFTHDPPSDFAFAALGRRADLPWMHRVRMLALEGQIHERDAGHPVLALTGRFDFAFLAAFVLPLVLIVLLHDLRAAERAAGRHDLLIATSAHAAPLWHLRALVRAAAVLVCALLPLVVVAGLGGTAAGTLAWACVFVAAYLALWTGVCAALAAWRQPAATILAALIGLWIVLGVLIPAAGRMAIDRAVPVPSGAEIIMTQREAVNDAWDLPKQATMQAFVERHPQWAAHAAVERPFEWKWYYAFQQVGDQQTEALAGDYWTGRLERDRRAGQLALAAPPVLLQRALQGLAATDLRTLLAYEARVRAYHAALRAFYYPRLFLDTPFDAQALEALPPFVPDRTDG